MVVPFRSAMEAYLVFLPVMTALQQFEQRMARDWETTYQFSGVLT